MATKRIIQSVFISIILMVLAWRILVVNMSEYYAEIYSPTILQWQADHPKALQLSSRKLIPTNEAQARQSLLQSIFVDPTHGKTVMALALIWQAQKQTQLAEKAAEFAHFVAPLDPVTQRMLGAFWVQAGQPIRAIQHWDAALQADAQLAKTLFPALLALIETPALRSRAFEPFKTVGRWWPSFFSYALEHASDSDTLKGLYIARGDAVEVTTRRLYLDYLIQHGDYVGAYFMWLNGLTADTLFLLGNVYDGGFEQYPTQEGFAWRLENDAGFMSTFEPMFGQIGNKSLHISFLSGIHRRVLVSQYLMLDPGQYVLSGKSRLENLSAGQGIFWSLQCLDVNKNKPIAQTKPFTGSDIWQSFEVIFEIPKDNCPIQQLRLEADGSVNDDYADYSGSAWFDGLEISQHD